MPSCFEFAGEVVCYEVREAAEEKDEVVEGPISELRSAGCPMERVRGGTGRPGVTYI